MKTLTPTKARCNLSALLKEAIAGEDIGIVFEGQIIALRPVKVISTDYAFREYSLTDKEMNRITEQLNEEVQKARSAKKTRLFTGNIEDLLED